MEFDAKFMFGVSGILIALVAYVLSQRRERLVGIPVMTGYGDDHERAMVDGTSKVLSTSVVYSIVGYRLNPSLILDTSTQQLPSS